ncbi:histidine phosphatase family protein [Streptomyces sp. NPDC056149]|uniref:histidine phosphatase family protein n=1 Tax=Streptomyces sp. NPDC056149 TaxID=3345728 RepID=UPI0035DB1D2F
MVDIWLMRHGAYEGHRPGHHAPFDATLTSQGRDQIRHSLPLPDGTEAIVTSPLPRARQTAELIADLTQLPIIATSALLAEWRAPSIVLNHSPDTYPSAYLEWRERRLSQPSLRCGDGESLTDLHTRAGHCVEFLQRTAHAHGNLLAVSHKLLLGVVTRREEGPAAFINAATEQWPFAERRPLRTPVAPQRDGATR